jgi:hypothetical protein
MYRRGKVTVAATEGWQLGRKPTSFVSLAGARTEGAGKMKCPMSNYDPDNHAHHEPASA